MLSMDIVRFLSIECRLQMSGELSVWWMAQAWEYAQVNSWDRESLHGSYRLPGLQDVINIGRLVEPNVNVRNDRSEFRTVNVRVGSDIKRDWQDVPDLMVGLMESPLVSKEFAAEFFKAYEEVHPWRDGNGRSGVILFNWLNGTLDAPVWAPNYWSDPRRTIGFGAS